MSVVPSQVLEYRVPWAKGSVEDLLENVKKDYLNQHFDWIPLKTRVIEQCLDFMVDYLIGSEKGKDVIFNAYSNIEYYESIVNSFFYSLVTSKDYFEYLEPSGMVCSECEDDGILSLF